MNTLKLEDGLTLFDYGAKPSETVQCQVRYPIAEAPSSNELENNTSTRKLDNQNMSQSSSFNNDPTKTVLTISTDASCPPSLQDVRVGSRVECLDIKETGAWFEGVVERVSKEPVWMVEVNYVFYYS